MKHLDELVTLLVKTFERPDCAERLVRSVRARYPTVPVLVADDSRRPRPIAGAECHALPFDSGLSAGRNYLLERVRTPYIVLLDDDFVFVQRTDLDRFVSILEQHAGLDMVGGEILSRGKRCARAESLELTDGVLKYARAPRGNLDAWPAWDFVTNFWIARTEAVRCVGWDSALKLAEHTDFFLRAKGRLTITFSPDVAVEHHKGGSRDYRRFRRRAATTFTSMFMRKHGIQKIVRAK